jgi:hypothetical protein
LIRHHPRQAGWARKLAGALYRKSRKFASAVLMQMDRFNFGKSGSRANPVIVDNPVNADWDVPRIVREGFWNHNIVHFRDTYFGVPQSLGEFTPALAESEADGPYLRGRSLPDVKKKILAQMNISLDRRIRNKVRNLLVRRGAAA